MRIAIDNKFMELKLWKNLKIYKNIVVWLKLVFSI